MSEIGLLIAAAALFAYALAARRLSNSVVTAPMAFLALGWALAETGLLSVAGHVPEFGGGLGAEHGAGHEEAHGGAAAQALHLLAETTLVIVLFIDAATTDFMRLRQRFQWPERMLVIGLPLAIAFGTIIGLALLPEWPIWEIALLAAILAPTDAALGQAVVTNSAVPERTRQTLTVESGVNDGLALPAVLFFACMAVGGVHDGVQSNWLVFVGEQIGLGALAGAVIGGIGGVLVRAAAARGLSDEAFGGIGALALAGLSYLAAIAIGGNGFLAAFVGGLGFGAAARQHCHFVFEFMETEGQLLVIGTFLLLGAVLLPIALVQIDATGVALILLSLVVVRPLAIWLSLWRTDAAPLTKAFLGWFGPRGLATALFALLVLEQFDALSKGAEILTIATIAVAISAVLHGMTAAPGARWYGARRAQAAAGSDSSEAGDGAALREGDA